MSVPDNAELRAAEKEVHTAYTALRVALERLHHVLNPPGTMQGDVGPRAAGAADSETRYEEQP